jgi:glycosyltransferase involved in cell wall biosynthesis
MEALINDSELRSQLSENAVETISRSYTWEQVSERLGSFFRAVRVIA